MTNKAVKYNNQACHKRPSGECKTESSNVKRDHLKY